ncbi:MAG: ComF family protein [bacterium]
MRHPRLAGLFSDLLDLVHPQACAGCGAPSCAVCPGCAARLAGSPFAHRPEPCPPGCPPVFAAASYEGIARQVILGWKERGRRGAARSLGSALAAAIAAGARAHGAGVPLIVVPVPASRRALRQRGEDVLMRVARNAAGELRAAGCAALVRPALSLERTPRDQSGLDARARRANLRGAMRARSLAGAAPPGEIVLVDDVVTTGVTLAEAVRALEAAGRAPLFAATIAATPRRRAPR